MDLDESNLRFVQNNSNVESLCQGDSGLQESTIERTGPDFKIDTTEDNYMPKAEATGRQTAHNPEDEEFKQDPLSSFNYSSIR